jgi:beta-glucosidase
MSPENHPAFRNPELPLEQRLDDLCNRLSIGEKIDQMSHQAKGVERLGIAPYSWWSECLHGVARNGRATVFPQAINLAATFDPDLVEKIASAIGDEARAKFNESSRKKNYSRYTGLTFWTPTINIFRDPRWGRGQETYGEDPVLTATIGRAMVRGLQGRDPRHLKVAACAKHFAAHSGPEWDRQSFDAKVGAYDLHDTYLPAFRELVEEGVEIVMGAYNRLNGEPCCGNRWLLTELLREKWGFQGHVTSDCWAIDGFHIHSKVTCSQVKSVALSLEAGCDLCCGDVYPLLLEALQRGLVSEEQIERSFRRLMRIWFRLGLFDPQEKVAPAQVSSSVINCEAHRAFAREAAAKSCVLLKNKNNILPLPTDLKVMYVVGPGAASVDVLLGNYFGASGRLTTILEGIAARVEPSCAVEYKLGTQYTQPNSNPIDWVSYEASKADVCVAVMGVHPMMEGEEGEAIMSADIGDRTDLDLPAHQARFLKKIRKAGARLVVLLTGGGPITCPEVFEMADALMWIGYPGEAGGEGVADVLFGKESPSGRLPITWPRDVRDLPAFEDYRMDGRTYRYMEKEPLFPFGFGLSYVQFEYEHIAASHSTCGDGSVDVSVRVKNSGERTAEEVVQIYLRWPEYDGKKPLQALRAFRRVTVPARETVDVAFNIPRERFELVDEQGERFLPSGSVEIIAAGACPVLRSLTLGAATPQTTTIKLL